MGGKDNKMIEVGKINRATALRYLGMKAENVDEVMESLLNEAEELLQKDAKVTFVCGIYDILRHENNVLLDECNLEIESKDIEKLLSDSKKAVLLCATISSYVDTRLRKLQITNMPLAIVYDALASVAIDQVVDSIQTEVNKQVPGYVQTMRFSPGYGDMPLTMQKTFLDILQASKRAGISLTEGGMLTPVKSITAIFGMRDIKELSLENISTIIPKNGGCGDKSVCGKCRHKDSCELGSKTVEEDK